MTDSLWHVRSYDLEDIAISKRDSSGRTVEAFAAIFDVPADVADQDGIYAEKIHRSAFNDSISKLAKQVRNGRWPVPVFYNHARNMQGGASDRYSMPIGTPVHIEATSRGLLTVTEYSRTALADEVLENIRNDAIRGQSFSGLFLASDGHRRGQRLTPNRDGSLPVVTRTKITLREYGPTPVPVYAEAAILAVRNQVSDPDGEGEATLQSRRAAIHWSDVRADIRKVIR